MLEKVTILAVSVIILVFPCLLLAVSASDYINVSVSEAKQMIDSNSSIVILDVRNQSEYDSKHIRSARLIPLYELGERLGELNKTDTMLVYCQLGARSTAASQLLADNSFLHVYNMIGGITAWINEGYPVYIRYSSIQEAINNANEGAAIFVSSGLYIEHVTVNKSIALVGESKDTTIIDGAGGGTIFYVKANNISISDFTIRYCGCACSGYCGVYVEGYHHNVNITNNHIVFNGYGIKIDGTQRIIIAYNNITNNNSWSTVIYNSSNILMLENIITNNLGGIDIENSTDTTVSSNTISNSIYGTWMSKSDNNTFFGNTFSSNTGGTHVEQSNNNSVFRNNFVGNSYHAFSLDSVSFWDNGLEGNFWSGYNGTDLSSPYQNVTGSDGIGDTPYIIDANNQDNYPLMGMFSSFNTSLGYSLNVISNSTIEDFAYSESNSTIKMYVSNMTTNQTYGFCRVCIPHTLMDVNTMTVIIDDGSTPVLYHNYALYDDEINRWIYFVYEHSTHKIDIIPEFPSFIILQLVMIATLLTVMYYRRELS